MTLAGASHLRAQQCVESHAAQPDHRHPCSGKHLRRVERRAYAGEHRAAEQRGLVEGQPASIFTTEPRFTTQYSAKADTPTW